MTHLPRLLMSALFSLLLVTWPMASAANASPQQIVQETTNRLLSDLAAHKEHYKSDPDAFYRALNTILGEVIDGEGIAKSVMTVKYSRNASAEQIQRFQENFKRSLLAFYGRALLEYNNNGIRVLPGRQEGQGRASVRMEVSGQNGVIYPVTYSMVQVNGKWLLRNVIINGINVGKLFRDQFENSMRENAGNLDRTIDGWGRVVANARATSQ